MPEQMSEKELKGVVQEVISGVGASGPGDFGKVMGVVMGKVKGRADGGMVNNTPISVAVRLGAKRVFVFPTGFFSTPDEDPKNLQEILTRALSYLLNRQLTTDLQIYQDQVELIVIPPPHKLSTGPEDFSKSSILIDEAYKITQNWLDNGGMEKGIGDYPMPCNVHSSEVFLAEAKSPEKEKGAIQRIKANVTPVTDDIKEKISVKAEEIKESISRQREKIEESVQKTKVKLKTGTERREKSERPDSD